MNHQFTILPTQEGLNYGTCVMANVFLLGRIALGLVWRTGEGWRTCLKWSLMNPSNSCCPIVSFPNDTSNENWIVNLCIVHSLSVHDQTRTYDHFPGASSTASVCPWSRRERKSGRRRLVRREWKGMHNFCENFSPDGSVTANVSPSTRSARMVDARCNLYAIQICFER